MKNVTYFTSTAAILLYLIAFAWQIKARLGGKTFSLPAAACLLTALIMHGVSVYRSDLASLNHIILSILALIMCLLAGLEALLLHCHNHLMRSHPPSPLIKKFPALVTMENILFEIIFWGFVVLSLALLSGWLYLSPNGLSLAIVQKLAFSVIAWIIFGLLLAGHVIWGWRGVFAVRWTLLSMLLLFVGFIGSRL